MTDEDSDTKGASTTCHPPRIDFYNSFNEPILRECKLFIYNKICDMPHLLMFGLQISGESLLQLDFR